MNETESAPRKKRGRAWLAAGIAVVLVAAAAAGFFWCLGSYRQDSFFEVSALTGALPAILWSLSVGQSLVVSL